MRWLSRLTFILLLTVAGVSCQTSPGEPDGPVRADDPLTAAQASCTSEHAAQVVAQRVTPTDGTVTILAIGSSSTEGIGASAPQFAYPAVLERLLAGSGLPVRFKVVNAGVGGNTLTQIRQRLAPALAAHRPQIVLLQTGTIEGIEDRPSTAEFHQALSATVQALKAGGQQVILLDSQYFAGGEAPRYRTVQAAIASVAGAEQVTLIQRYDLQRRWVMQGLKTYADYLSPADNFHMNDFGYDCTARIVRGAVIADFK